MLAPPLRALSQFDDPAFLGAVLKGVLWSALAFAGLAAGLGWAGHESLTQHGWLGSALGLALAALAGLFLFLPLATAIATLFTDQVAEAVERRFYPLLPPATPAPLAEQIQDGVVLGLRVLLVQVLALLLALILPGPGFILGWAVTAWAIGRGLFVTVAMRRLGRREALACYRARRGAVLAQGALIAAAGLVPVLNLFAAVLGTAAMVHVLHRDAPNRSASTSPRAGL